MTSASNGQELPNIVTLDGTNTHRLAERARAVKAPMGPRDGRGPRLAYERAFGSNVWDVDGNRYVDLCAGFGSMLLGHGHPEVTHALQQAAPRLVLALGDVYDAEPKIALLERLAALVPTKPAQGILGLSGADAVTAAIKTALLATGRPKLIAFEGSYHGLSYAPLSALGLRSGYRTPFESQLNPHVTWLPFPDHEQAHQRLEQTLRGGDVGAVLLEPILGRGGIRPLTASDLKRVRDATAVSGTLLIADEIWTGLGRSGSWLWTERAGIAPDLICLGKGLGGGLPVSACMGSAELMSCWSQESEVVHTSTHAGSPLGAVCALATLDVLERDGWVDRASQEGRAFREEFGRVLAPLRGEVRGEGFMLGIELPESKWSAAGLAGALLSRGFIVSLGGGPRDCLVLTPPLNVARPLLHAFAETLLDILALSEHQ